MPSVLDIKRRIRSVKNTRQITKAMQMVSAAKLRRAQERAIAARPYGQMLTNVLKSLVSRAETVDPHTGQATHPMLTQREENNILLIVVSGEKGLAGAFSTNIVKAAQRFLATQQGKRIEILTVGRKGRDFFRRRYRSKDAGASDVITTGTEHTGVLNRVKFASAKAVADEVVERYSNAEIDAVYLIYNEFKSVVAQRLVVDQILPIEEIGADDIRMAEGLSEEQRKQAIEAAQRAGVGVRAQDTSVIDTAAAKFGTAQVDYIYEQPASELFAGLLPRYIGVQIYRAMLESEAAEHAARMTAMDSATSNAGEMIDSLTLVMNRARQAKITREIIEIVSGAAAL